MVRRKPVSPYSTSGDLLAWGLSGLTGLGDRYSANEQLANQNTKHMSTEQSVGRTCIGIKKNTKNAFDRAAESSDSIGKPSADDFLRHLLAENGYEVPDQ